MYGTANDKLTQKSGANVLGNLVAGSARLGKVAQLFVQHPLELQQRQWVHEWKYYHQDANEAIIVFKWELSQYAILLEFSIFNSNSFVCLRSGCNEKLSKHS